MLPWSFLDSSIEEHLYNGTEDAGSSLALEAKDVFSN